MCQNGVYENEKGWELLFTGVPTLVYINENKYINARITPGVMCVCVMCVFTQISHISKFATHFFEYRYMHDAADNGMLPEQIALFPKTDCKSEYIVIQLLNSVCKVSGF